MYLNGRMDKWCIYIVEYYIAVRRKRHYEIYKEMNETRKNIILNEAIQT